jgi:hypothetical protein
VCRRPLVHPLAHACSWRRALVPGGGPPTSAFIPERSSARRRAGGLLVAVGIVRWTAAHMTKALAGDPPRLPALRACGGRIAAACDGCSAGLEAGWGAGAAHPVGAGAVRNLSYGDGPNFS